MTGVFFAARRHRLNLTPAPVTDQLPETAENGLIVAVCGILRVDRPGRNNNFLANVKLTSRDDFGTESLSVTYSGGELTTELWFNCRSILCTPFSCR